MDKGYPTEFIEGSLYWVRWEFARKGMGIPMHSHPPNTTEHLTVVLRGSCSCYGPDDAWERTLREGDVCDFSANEQRHELKALQDNTVILNIQKAPIDAAA